MIELHQRVKKFTFDFYITIIEKIYEKEEEDKNMLDFRTETFLMVCETMNFTEAARRLHITQPAVSQHIHFLEKEYDARLFSYHNKQLYMTDAGEILKKRLMTMKNDQLVLKQEIKGKEQKEESLSLGVTMTIGEYAIVDKLANFLLKYPEMNLHIHYGNTTQLLTLLDQGIINMALVEGNYPKENYEHRRYSTEDYIAVCATDHKFEAGIPDSMKELLHERLLVREAGSGTRNILEELLMARGMKIQNFKHYVEVENMHTIIGFLKKDCGISFMYKVAVEEELEKGILKEIQLSDFKMQHDFDFIWEKGSIYSGKYCEVCEELA